MRTFSTAYFIKTIELFARYPTAALNILKGSESVGHRIYLSRKEKYAKKPVTQKSVNGYVIYLNPKDTDVISPSIGADGFYELEETELFKKIVKKGSTVIDVGANIGWYTLLAAKVAGINGKVIAFEPAPENFSLLTKSIAKNNFENVQAYNLCVSTTKGTTKLYLGTQNKGSHSIKSRTGNDSIEVDTIDLDTMLRELEIHKVDLMKIDVEGAEPEVLEGAIDLLSKKRIQNIFLEWNTNFWADKEKLIEVITKNYEIYEFTKSPFLIKKLNCQIHELPNTELFLHLKD